MTGLCVHAYVGMYSTYIRMYVSTTSIKLVVFSNGSYQGLGKVYGLLN